MLMRLAIGTLLIVGLSLGIFKLLMSPPSNELGLMALFLGITAAVSGLIGYIAYRLGWIDISPTLRWTLLGTTGLPVGLVAVSVITAAVVLVSGVFYFRRMERTFADVV